MNDVLVLDAQTLRDLEVFAPQGEGSSLFALCNFTRTEGGARVLRRRMEQPWRSADRILETQRAVSFIAANAALFEQLGSLSFSANRVEHYLKEIIPVVMQDGPVEFGLAALSMWANHDRHYSSILIGVQFAAKLVQSLNQFAAHEELDHAGGELAPLVAELRSLLERDRILEMPGNGSVDWFWRSLRADQIYRLHEKAAFTRMLEIIHEIDALTAMALATREHGFTLPEIVDAELAVQAAGVWHPFVEQAVTNDMSLDQEKRVLFLTGPNMAGKTTYLRSFATLLYFAQLGMGVPARQCRIAPADRLFCSISLSDDLQSGISYFRAEALRVRAVAEALAQGLRVVSVMDEPFKGTNVKDALDASLAILMRFADRDGSLFVFSSHLIELAETLGQKQTIDCRHFDAEERQARLKFDYQLRPGVSDQRLGMRVLQEEGIFDLLDGGQPEIN